MDVFVLMHLCLLVPSLQMQYSFIYQALLEYYLYGDTELDVSSLEGHLHKLHNTFTTGDRVGLEEEFKVRHPILSIRLHAIYSQEHLLECRISVFIICICRAGKKSI